MNIGIQRNIKHAQQHGLKSGGSDFSKPLFSYAYE